MLLVLVLGIMGEIAFLSLPALKSGLFGSDKPPPPRPADTAQSARPSSHAIVVDQASPGVRVVTVPAIVSPAVTPVPMEAPPPPASSKPVSRPALTRPPTRPLAEAASVAPSPPTPRLLSAPSPPKAAVVSPAVTPVPKAAAPLPAAPLMVKLNFTADEAEVAEAFARKLRRQGFAVTSIIIPDTPGRWPGVAFFFDSDEEISRQIAQELRDVTGRHEHARLSPRHPYPRPGTVEVSLLNYARSRAEASRGPARTHQKS